MTTKKLTAKPAPAMTPAETIQTIVETVSPGAQPSEAIAYQPVSRITFIASERAKQLEAKMMMLGNAKQKLAQACDTGKDSDRLSSEAARLLFLATQEANATPADVSGALGDVFGFKAKKDGTPGKTPDGKGEMIRKRVNRLSDAAHFIRYSDAVEDGADQSVLLAIGTPSAFFADLDRFEVSAILLQVREEIMPVFTAYDNLGALRPKKETVNAIFNPAAIAKMVTALGADGAADKIDDELLLAYGALIGALTFITTEMVPVEQPGE